MKKYTLEMKLEGTELKRTVSMCGGMNFEELHQVIQVVFGWEDYHMHSFTAGKITIGNYEDYEDEDELPVNFRWEGELGIDLILLNTPKVIYEYDFGDGWRVEIKVKKMEDSDTFDAPKLIKASGGMAQEDCGGPCALMEMEREDVDIDGLNLILEHTFE